MGLEITTNKDGTNRSRIECLAAETVFNEDSQDIDFRIESNAQTNAFFIDSGNEAASMAIPLTITTADNNAQFILKSTDADSDAGPFIDMQRDSGSPADNDFIGKIRFAADDDGGNVTEFAQIQAQILDASNGSEDGTLQIRTTVGGSVGTPRVDFLAGETVFNEGSNDLDFRVESNANANCLFVDAGNDKIGIRTGTPQFGLSFSQGTSDSSRLGWHDSSNNKRASIICSSASDSLSFHTGTSDAERVRILSSGGFVVGGTTVDSYGGVAATNTMYGLVASGAYALGLTQNTTSAGGGRVLGLRNVTDFNNTGNEVITYIGDATNRFLVVSNGNVTNTNNSYGAISDQKLKEQITDASSQWDDIKALTVRKYKMKDEVLAEGDSNAAWKLGVVAQELETAGMAGLVDERIDRDEDGNDAGTTTKQVKYSVLYMKAVKALQEAMTRIETLETKVAALEAS